MLVVDEAQHALTTPEGDKALLRSKPRGTNSTREAGRNTVVLVMTGSSRDKLALMVANRKQAFYGAEITRFPLLDDPFVETHTRKTSTDSSTPRTNSTGRHEKAFELVGRRP